MSPLIKWPWYLRWTLGLFLVVAGLIPLALVGALCETLVAAWRASSRSGAWRIITLCLLALVFGDR